MDTRYPETFYHIGIVQACPGSAVGMTIDGAVQGRLVIPLMDDQREHRVEMRIEAG